MAGPVRLPMAGPEWSLTPPDAGPGDAVFPRDVPPGPARCLSVGGMRRGPPRRRRSPAPAASRSLPYAPRLTAPAAAAGPVLFALGDPVAAKAPHQGTTAGGLR